MTSVSPAPIVRAPMRAYTPEEWEQKRLIITRLYHDEVKSLGHVRAVLAQRHAFRPT